MRKLVPAGLVVPATLLAIALLPSCSDNASSGGDKADAATGCATDSDCRDGQTCTVTTGTCAQKSSGNGGGGDTGRADAAVFDSGTGSETEDDTGSGDAGIPGDGASPEDTGAEIDGGTPGDDAGAMDVGAKDGGASGDGGAVTDGGVAADGGANDGGGELDIGSWLGPQYYCFAPPPAGSPKPPAFKKYSGGTCPVLTNNYTETTWNPTGGYMGNGAWEADPVTNGLNEIVSSGNHRKFYLLYPPDWDGSYPLPVLWAYHWMAGEAYQMVREAEIQHGVKVRPMLIIVPESPKTKDGKDVYAVNQWPFPPAIPTGIPEGKIGDEAEMTYFDDVMACVSEQFNINPSCVSAMGVSAGALWSVYFASKHPEYFSSVLSLSGGYSSAYGAWQAPNHKYHALVLWGGCKDMCVLDMAKMSLAYVLNLTGSGQFTMECVHPCEHGTPPVPRLNNDPVEPRYGPIWDFALNHPYWMAPQDSPYLKGLPDVIPQAPRDGTDIGTCGPAPSQCSGGPNNDYTTAHLLCKIATGPEQDCKGTFP